MGTKTGIGWTDRTHNIVRGCTKISDGCKFCYAASIALRFPELHGVWGPNGTRIFADHWEQDIEAAERAALKQGRSIRVFINSMSDPCEGAHGPDGESKDGVRPDYLPLLDRIFAAAEKCSHVILQWLTKRPWNLVKWWQASGRKAWPANLWIGVSVENQESANTRIPWLLKIPAKVCFLSMEPLLGPVDLTEVADAAGCGEPGCTTYVDALTGNDQCGHGYWAGGRSERAAWVIVGCESGNRARPMELDWVRSIRDQCVAAGVPFFFKQATGPDGKVVELPLLDGQQWAQFPEVETPRNPTLFGAR